MEKEVKILKKRGQSSVEYLSVVAIALMLLIPSTVLFMNHSRSTTDSIVNSQLDFVGNSIIGSAEEMFVLGKESWVTIEVYLPSSFTDAYITDNRELFFDYDTRSGPGQVVFFSTRFLIGNGVDACDTPCSLNLDTGRNELRIRSNGTAVNIMKTN